MLRGMQNTLCRGALHPLEGEITNLEGNISGTKAEGKVGFLAVGAKYPLWEISRQLAAGRHLKIKQREQTNPFDVTMILVQEIQKKTFPSKLAEPAFYVHLPRQGASGDWDFRAPQGSLEVGWGPLGGRKKQRSGRGTASVTGESG